MTMEMLAKVTEKMMMSKEKKKEPRKLFSMYWLEQLFFLPVCYVFKYY